ncbi:hypothetical protein Tco_0662831 [Tanacetum coccineum]
MRTASAAAKPCQGDSSEFYLITGSNPDGGSRWAFLHMIKEACKEDGDDVLGSCMEVKVQCKGNKVLNKGLEVGSKD